MHAFRLFAALLALVATPLSAETRLAMAEEVGCIWCARWNTELGAIYPLTPEGTVAPLLRFDKNEPLPEGISLARPVIFTPTFILLINGEEFDRIEGYPGEDFFWGLLNQMMVRAGALEDTS